MTFTKLFFPWDNPFIITGTCEVMPRADEAIIATTATTGLTDRSTTVLLYNIQRYQQTCYMHSLPTVPVFSAPNSVVDPDPYNFGLLGFSWIRIRIRHYFVWIRILPSTSKKIYIQKEVSKKNLKTKLIFCWHLVRHWRKKQNPDPYQNVTDSQHCFRVLCFKSCLGVLELSSGT